MQKYLATFILAWTAAAAWPQPVSAQSAPIPSTAAYACDFENSYCDFSEQSAVGDAPPSAARRSSIVQSARSGASGVRLHTQPGDSSVHGSGTWERDDLQKPADSSYCNEGQEEWWAISVMFPSDYVYPPGSEGGVVLDFHHNADSGLPNFSVDTMPGTGMRTRGYGGPSLNGGQYEAHIVDPYGAVGDVTRNAWYDFVFHVKWSSSSAGLMEGWLNGRKFQSYSGATLYSGISCYLKLANYHGAFGQPSSIVFDRVARGASAADVAIGALEGVNGAAAPATATATPAAPASPATSPVASPSGAAGKAAASTTMDSSSYVVAAGQGVTFTVRVLGGSATPTGAVTFSSDGAPIAGCGGVALSSGVATCSTASLPGGSHAITGLYSGDAAYDAAQAGPITQGVAGSAPAAAPSALPVKFGLDSSSYTIAAGQAVIFTATIPGAGGTVAFADNGGIIAGCGSAAVSSSGVATCAAGALAAGSHAITGTYSGSGSYPAGIAGPITQTVTAVATLAAPASAAAPNVAGLWWGGAAESGWGLNLAQQGSTLFATWFTYDANGDGRWLVMSDVAMTSPNTYSGTVYRATGPALAAVAFDPARVARTPVGTATFVFGDADNGVFTATVDGSTVTKPITRLAFDARTPVCVEGGDAAATSNYQDLWWRSSGTESGWGLNLAHQGDTLFMTWFTYGADGKAMWLVASDVARDASGRYSGTVYRTTGPAFDAASWDASRVVRMPVGTVSFAFGDGANAVFSYTVDGVSGSRPISRLQFAAPATVCRPS